MKKNVSIEVVNYVRELIETANTNKSSAYSLKATEIASALLKKFPEQFPKKEIGTSSISKYVKKAGYRYNVKSGQYEPLPYITIDDSKLEFFDQPITTIIKTASRDSKNTINSILKDFKNDIIYYEDKSTNDGGLFIIYSTKYNLGSAIYQKMELDSQKYYNSEEADS